jgi:hypothetical protein
LPQQVRLVHLGRPWAPLDCFDLIITTPQYQLPARPNILHNTAPLFRVTATRLAQAAAAWKPRLAHLPRPWVGVLVGGNSGAFTLDVDTARALAGAADSMAEAEGGALLVTTSARTPPAAAAAIEARISVPGYFFRWSLEAAANPYWGYLALADRFIVTADSVSMLTEACGTQKPVYIFDPKEAPRFAGMGAGIGAGRRLRFQTLVQHLSVRIGPRRMRRDVGAIQRRLIGEGRAAWLGEPFPEDHRPPPPGDLERAVERVHALFE